LRQAEEARRAEEINQKRLEEQKREEERRQEEMEEAAKYDEMKTAENLEVKQEDARSEFLPTELPPAFPEEDDEDDTSLFRPDDELYDQSREPSPRMQNVIPLETTSMEEGVVTEEPIATDAPANGSPYQFDPFASPSASPEPSPQSGIVQFNFGIAPLSPVPRLQVVSPSSPHSPSSNTLMRSRSMTSVNAMAIPLAIPDLAILPESPPALQESPPSINMPPLVAPSPFYHESFSPSTAPSFDQFLVASSVPFPSLDNATLDADQSSASSSSVKPINNLLGKVDSKDSDPSSPPEPLPSPEPLLSEHVVPVSNWGPQDRWAGCGVRFDVSHTPSFLFVGKGDGHFLRFRLSTGPRGIVEGVADFYSPFPSQCPLLLPPDSAGRASLFSYLSNCFDHCYS